MAGIKMLPGETESEYWERIGKIIDGLDDLVRRNGRVIARLPAGTLGSKDLIKSLTGIFKGNYDLDEVKTEVLREKYGLVGR